MAPLDPNGTAELLIDYTSGGAKHVASIRLAAGTTSGDAVAVFNAINPEMRAVMLSDSTITGARFRAAGSNLSFPAIATSLSGTVVGTTDPDLKPNFLSLTGRSADGRRVRFTVFTAYATPTADTFRDYTPPAAVTALIAELVASGARTISGQLPTWNSYVNYGVNAYYQRKARRT